MSAERVFGLEARFFVFSGLDLARAAALQKYREGKGMKRKLVFLVLLIVIAVCVVGFIGCSSTEVMQQQYVVYFDTNGHGHLDNSYVSADIIEEAPIPSADYDNQYIFAGWYTSPDCNDETKVSFPYIVTGNITFYAKWEKQEIYFSFTLNESGTEYILSDCHGNPSEIIIPDTYHDLPVTEVSDMAFRECNELTNIIFSENSQVTNIPSYAFNYCYNLRAITLPANLMEIGFAAFPNIPLTIYYPGEIKDWCEIEGLGDIMFSDPAPETGLKLKLYIDTQLVQGPLTIPDDVTKISDGAFANTMITSLVLPDGITSIGARSFWNCFELSTIEFGKSSQLTKIGESAFENCTALTTVKIPEGVTKIEDYTFSGCSNLKNATIGNNVTNIGIGAFEYCTELINIIFGQNRKLNSIDVCAFDNCRSLKSIEIPDGVAYIAYEAFSNCIGLTSVTIPDSVTTIGSSAFANEVQGSTLTIYCETAEQPVGWDSAWNKQQLFYPISHNRLPVVWDYRRNDIADDGNIYTTINGLRYVIKDNAAVVAKQPINIITAIIPAEINYKDATYNVTSIADSAFKGCSDLATITIPEGVTSIGSYAFEGCSDLATITIPEGVTSIGSDAFSGCSGLAAVTIPASVTSIDNGAFSGCSNLVAITIPASVTRIGSHAFSNCSSLTKIDVAEGNPVYHSEGNCVIETVTETLIAGCKNSKIPSDGSVTCISVAAFEGCSGLTEITIPDGVTSIEGGAFRNCSSLTEITIPASVRSIGSNAFNGCSNLTEITIPDGVTSIEVYTFAYCFSLTEITIPTSVTSIDSYAFYNCYSLTEITLPEGITNIGQQAFYACGSLTEIMIPDSVTSISSEVFSGTALYSDETNWENGVLYIGNHLIKAKTTLSGSYAIKSGTLTIAYGAFEGCSGLAAVTIPESLTSIDNGAFYGCSGLAEITIPSSVTSIGAYAFEGCSGLTEITIPDSVTSIDSYAFFGTAFYDDETNWENGVLYIGNHLIKAKTTLSGSYVIKSGTLTIAYGAFEGCSGLTEITFPESVTSIGYGAFSSCSNLTSVTFDTTEGWWYASSSTATSGTEIASSDLADPVTAATYLVSTYDDYYWHRS